MGSGAWKPSFLDAGWFILQFACKIRLKPLYKLDPKLHLCSASSISMPLFPLNPRSTSSLLCPLPFSICPSFHQLNKFLFLAMCSIPNHCGEHQDIKSNRAPLVEMTHWGNIVIGLWWHLVRGHRNVHLCAVPATRSCKIPEENVYKENGVMESEVSLSARTGKLGWTVWKIPLASLGGPSSLSPSRQRLCFLTQMPGHKHPD